MVAYFPTIKACLLGCIEKEVADWLLARDLMSEISSGTLPSLHVMHVQVGRHTHTHTHTPFHSLTILEFFYLWAFP